MTGDEWLKQKIREGALVSGKPVPANFDKGWGRPPFLGGKMIAHHWTADRTHDLGEGAYGLRSACGVVTVATRQVPLLEPGNLPYCQRCENALMRRL